MDFSTYLEEQKTLEEKQILFNQGKRYGQAVFLAGGAGSGKGFAASKFMDTSSFKTRDVDSWKEAVVKLDRLKGRFPEIRDMDLRNPEDVAALHQFVKDKGFKDKSFDSLLRSIDQRRLPNILFDITGKDRRDFEKRLVPLTEVGYKPRNIHIVWILSNYKVAVNANASRDRVVPDDILLDTHMGAASTFIDFIRRGLPDGVDGSVHVILNNRENTLFATYPDGTVNTDVIKDFVYLTLKEPGRRMKSDKEVMRQLTKWIRNNVPEVESLEKELRQTEEEIGSR